MPYFSMRVFIRSYRNTLPGISFICKNISFKYLPSKNNTDEIALHKISYQDFDFSLKFRNTFNTFYKIYITIHFIKF